MTPDPRIPAPDDCVLRHVFDKWAARTPDKTFVVFTDGTGWTYRQFHDRVRARAAALRGLGMKQGDHVLVWLPNGPECLVSWFAINYVGGVYVPINTAYRGTLLEHVIRVSNAQIAIVHASLQPRLATIDRSRIDQVVVLNGEPDTGLPGVTVHSRTVFDAPAAPD